MRAEPAVWDDPAQDWEAYDLVVVRSAWDYAPRREEFVCWAESVPRVLNRADVIRWNTDKHYLEQLPWAVATQFLAPGDAWDPPSYEYVVKPAVSAGSRDTARYGTARAEAARAQRHVRELLAAGRAVMVQPYLGAVEDSGETALIFFDGRFSHAIRKGPMLTRGRLSPSGLFIEENIRPRDPQPDELGVAEKVLDALPWPRDELLYARVDLLRGADATPVLVELELTEPSLFLSHGQGAADRLAACVCRRLA